MTIVRNLVAAIVVATLNLPTASLAQNGTPDLNYDASYCEFYVNSLGLSVSHYAGGGRDGRVLESYVSVNEADLVERQGGKILAVGLLANGKDVFRGSKIAPAYYLISVELQEQSMSDNARRYELRDFLYFIDVERADGETVRLWLKDGAQHFQWPSVHDNYPKHWVYRGPSHDTYVLAPSPIYNQREACR